MLLLPKVSVVIPAHNRKAITLACLGKLSNIATDGISLQVIVVDDGSTDGTAEAIEKNFSDVTVLRGDGNLWWSGATNLGVEYALRSGAGYILTLNDDVEHEPDFFSRMLETATKNSNSIVCGLVCYENKRDTVLSAGRYQAGFLGYKTMARYANAKVETLSDDVIEAELESGYAMLIPAELFRNIGLFDAKRFPHHMGDMDFVLRARKEGYGVLVDTRARLYSNPGKNYLFNVMVDKTFTSVVKSVFDLRSNAYWKTRLNFMLMHTNPVLLAPVSFFYYLVRMSMLLIIKLILPRSFMRYIAEKRYGKAIYHNQY